MPSDTIYGLSCRALDEKAVERIYQLKYRRPDKPLIILISNLKMLNALGVRYNKAITTLEKHWPGPLSVIFDAPNAPAWLTRGSGSLAVRWPADQELCKLINKIGPIISTSANPEGQKPAGSTNEAKKYFGDKVDFYVDAGELNHAASTVAVLKNQQLKVIRPGEVKI